MPNALDFLFPNDSQDETFYTSWFQYFTICQNDKFLVVNELILSHTGIYTILQYSTVGGIYGDAGATEVPEFGSFNGPEDYWES